MSSTVPHESSLDNVQSVPVAGSANPQPTAADPAYCAKALTATEWRELEDKASARSDGRGSSFKRWVDAMEAKVLEEQSMNTRFGIQEESDEDNESDKEDEEEGPYSEGEGISDDMDHKSAESDMDEDLDQEQRWDRAAFPSKRLPPRAGTLLAEDCTTEAEEQSDEYMSLTSDVSERQEEIDNCDIHSSHLTCTCDDADKQLGANNCDVHRGGLYCTCILGADEEEEREEDTEEVMLDLDGGEPARMPRRRADLQEEDYFTRSGGVYADGDS